MAVLCEHCNKAPATVHLTDIPSEGDHRERHLCERCAAREGITVHKPESISEILEGFVKHAAGDPRGADTTCPKCGMTFREFRTSGLLGCPNDYATFEELLTSLIERAHDGATHHVGRTPGRLTGAEPSPQAKLARLKRSLKESLEIEDYELAARLRDEIRAMESS